MPTCCGRADGVKEISPTAASPDKAPSVRDIVPADPDPEAVVQ
ncbi:hypothetical protein NXV19_15090 [Bacteroides fragilis]|nr:hypothetical protein NXW33_17545 [Bacteroides fragilis]UVQ17086.1 hypothetical protein NXV19_15090 [Bacteroides fragilis]